MSTPAPHKALPAKTVLLNGKYTIAHPLGEGGFGITYLAKHHLLGDVAIKELFLNSGTIYCTREAASGRTVVPQFDPAQFEKFKERFLNEAKTLYGLRKVPGVVNVLDIFEENGTVYFSMEYLNGEKLDDYVRNKTPLPEKESERIVLSLCDTLAQVHSQQILHCDIKPTNIILSPKGDITLIDFGIARYYEISDDSATRAAIYSPGYSPPEQKIPNEPLGVYSDVFSLGGTAYFVFTGQPPQSMDERMAKGYLSPRHFNPNISASIEAAINQSLEPRPQDRPQTIAAFLQIFRHTSDATQIELPKEGLAATVLEAGKTDITRMELQQEAIDATIIDVEKTDATHIDNQLVPSGLEDGKTIVDPVVSDDSKDRTLLDTSASTEKKTGFWENRRFWYWLVAILLFGMVAVIVWLYVPEQKPEVKAVLPPMPDYKVIVDLERDRLFVGEKQVLQIKTEPALDSTSKVRFYVNGIKTDENTLGISTYSDIFPKPGPQKLSVKIEVVRGIDQRIKIDSSFATFEVLNKNTPPPSPPPVPDVNLLPLAHTGQWFSQMPNQSRQVPITFENNLTQINERGNVGKAINVTLEDGSAKTGLEFALGTKVAGVIVGGSIVLPKYLPSSPVFVADIGFRRRDDKKSTVGYEIKLRYANGGEELLSGGIKQYDGKIKRIHAPIQGKPVSIYVEVGTEKQGEKERLILINPRILQQKTKNNQ